MKKTTINLQETVVDRLDQLATSTSRDRSQVIRDVLNAALHTEEGDTTRMRGRNGGTSRRLTESTRFIPNSSDAVGYSYAGAMHYLEQEKMIALATQLYSQNPLAHRIIEVITDFCIGDNISWETDDEDLDELFHEFWHHPRNAFHETQYQRVSELLLYGEQCYPVFVNPVTGLVQLGNIHPAFIKQTILDPDDYKLVIGVEVYGSSAMTTTYRTIFSEDSNTFLNDQALKMRNEMDGDCFYFAINTLSLPMAANGYGDRSYQIRGRSELLPLMDRLGIIDDLNYLNLDRIQILLSVIYDIEVAQGTPKDIEKIMEEFGIPNGPAVRAHDEKMKINVRTPTLGSSDIAGLFKMVTDEILGGAGIPSHWIGEGEANRASAMSMELPTLKKLAAKQKVVVGMFKKILDFQEYQGTESGRIKEESSFSIRVPTITRKDMINIGDALNKAVPNLEKAIDRGWIPPQIGAEIFQEIAQGYGVQYEIPEMLEELGEIIEEELLNPVEEPVPEEPEEQQPGEDPEHDYIAKDNPEESREEKEDRDELKKVSTSG